MYTEGSGRQTAGYRFTGDEGSCCLYKIAKKIEASQSRGITPHAYILHFLALSIFRNMYLSCSLNPFHSYGEIIATAAGGIVKNCKHLPERKTQDIPNRPERQPYFLNNALSLRDIIVLSSSKICHTDGTIHI